MVLLCSTLMATTALPELPSPFDLSSSTTSHHQDFFYRVPDSLRPVYRSCEPAEPIPLARNRSESPLSSSTDSIGSWRSIRSAAERQSEREARKRLLDISAGKLHGARDPPLRKHLHVYNTIKALQRDLELLDLEDLETELLCNLTNNNEMEVDEWPRKHQQDYQQHQQHQQHQQQQPITFDKVQEPEMTWWHSSPSVMSNNNQLQQGAWVGSSRDDESTIFPMSGNTGNSWGSPLWAHLDDLSANPLGGSWLSSGELSSLFAPHLHAASSSASSGLLMQA
ncbi:unnamed protein product, partial [Mesorhabditis belari]|uniref:Uncharacterized protein n=1 Tax=Mesorhabditis belari TaxID=2138241 RepID=A0AAF3FR81_9BILA